jgi:hypothetical protein
MGSPAITPTWLYRTTAGPTFGPFRHRGAPQTIDVLDNSTDDDEVIGQAMLIGSDGAGCAFWRLVVRGVELEGRWTVSYRRFSRYDAPPLVIEDLPDSDRPRPYRAEA